MLGIECGSQPDLVGQISKLVSDTSDQTWAAASYVASPTSIRQEIGEGGPSSRDKWGLVLREGLLMNPISAWGLSCWGADGDHRVVAEQRQDLNQSGHVTQHRQAETDTVVVAGSYNNDQAARSSTEVSSPRSNVGMCRQCHEKCSGHVLENGDANGGFVESAPVPSEESCGQKVETCNGVDGYHEVVNGCRIIAHKTAQRDVSGSYWSSSRCFSQGNGSERLDAGGISDSRRRFVKHSTCLQYRASRVCSAATKKRLNNLIPQDANLNCERMDEAVQTIVKVTAGSFFNPLPSARYALGAVRALRCECRIK
ncbi:hypothetical protein B0T20DRAFT_390159 [Sordaria brevicollis]|uniref:Uncharacterized protein n=1 Tax=Sordaria brevicollis TaxID=83679 RepID=A0AAE0UG82_SORBR|nr:hypothetical protein B0T20DRAFT_390159 [Sordaria brevicollis]